MSHSSLFETDVLLVYETISFFVWNFLLIVYIYFTIFSILAIFIWCAWPTITHENFYMHVEEEDNKNSAGICARIVYFRV